MQRDQEVYFDDIFEACVKIEDYTAGFTYETFIADDKTVDAVLRNLTVMGEAAKQLSEDARNRFPGIDWKRVCGLRDVVVHQYPVIDLEVIWEIATNSVRELRAALEARDRAG
ncbi:MAG: DUF86 domain-containing protein [Acidobacteriota bacterium]